jgi:hypothetical protein
MPDLVIEQLTSLTVPTVENEQATIKHFGSVEYPAKMQKIGV